MQATPFVIGHPGEDLTVLDVEQLRGRVDQGVFGSP